MAEYVIIGYCDKRIFCAETRQEALEKARQFAQDLKFTSWLLYNRSGDLLYDYPNMMILYGSK